ncbi:VOC family protein [Geodermatophilus sp. SYSU D01036]
MTTAGTTVRPQLTHMGINVYDVDAMEAFYTGVLGLIVTDRGVGKTFKAQLVFMSSSPYSHHQVVLASGRDPGSPKTSINQISFKVEDLDQLRAMYRRVRDHGVEGLRPLNHGNSWSIYFFDPEGNNVEVYCDSPWYISQPHGDLFDPEAPTEQILAETEAVCRNDPNFMPVEQWRDKVRAQLEERA